MKSKLTEHNGDGIMVCHLHREGGDVHLTNEKKKKKKKLCLHNPTRRMSSRLKGRHVQFYVTFTRKQKNSDTAAETIRLIKAAAGLIRRDIASLVDSKDVYPDAQSIRDHLNYVPRYTGSRLQRKIAT